MTLKYLIYVASVDLSFYKCDIFASVPMLAHLYHEKYVINILNKDSGSYSFSFPAFIPFVLVFSQLRLIYACVIKGRVILPLSSTIRRLLHLYGLN